MSPDHPDFEDLSAHHDGEAPEWDDHVSVCPSCQERLEELTRLSSTVAGVDPDDPAITGDGRDPVAVAVAAATAPPEAGADDGSESRADAAADASGAASPVEARRRWLLPASVAAMLLISTAVGALVARRSDPPATTTAGGSAPGERPTAGAEGTAAAADGRGGVLVMGDLGAIADRPALVARVRADLDAARNSASGPGEDLAARPEGAPAPDSAPAVPPPTPPDLVTPHPCELEARRDPGLRGPLVYQATAQAEGKPAVVLAFAPLSSSDGIMVEARALSDCRVLIRGAIL